MITDEEREAMHQERYARQERERQRLAGFPEARAREGRFRLASWAFVFLGLAGATLASAIVDMDPSDMRFPVNSVLFSCTFLLCSVILFAARHISRHTGH